MGMPADSLSLSTLFAACMCMCVDSVTAWSAERGWWRGNVVVVYPVASKERTLWGNGTYVDSNGIRTGRPPKRGSLIGLSR